MNEMILSGNEIDALAHFCLSKCEHEICPLERYDTLDNCPYNVMKKIKQNSDSDKQRTGILL